MRTSEFTEERTIKYMAQAWTKEPHNIYFSVSIVHYKRVLLLYSLNLIVHMEALVRFGSCMISVRLDSTVKIEKAGVFGFWNWSWKDEKRGKGNKYNEKRKRNERNANAKSKGAKEQKTGEKGKTVIRET